MKGENTLTTVFALPIDLRERDDWQYHTYVEAKQQHANHELALALLQALKDNTIYAVQCKPWRELPEQPDDWSVLWRRQIEISKVQEDVLAPKLAAVQQALFALQERQAEKRELARTNDIRPEYYYGEAIGLEIAITELKRALQT